jgi:hypothetical protein
MPTTDVTQRTQFERVELGDAESSRLLRPRSRHGPAIFTVIALPLLVVMSVAAVAIAEEWWQWLVFGVIVATAIGLIIAISPTRRA